MISRTTRPKTWSCNSSCICLPDKIHGHTHTTHALQGKSAKAEGKKTNRTGRASGRHLFSFLRPPLPSQRHLLTFPSITPHFLATTHPPQPNFCLRDHHHSPLSSCTWLPWHDGNIAPFADFDLAAPLNILPGFDTTSQQRQPPASGTCKDGHHVVGLFLLLMQEKRVVVFPSCVCHCGVLLCSPLSPLTSPGSRRSASQAGNVRACMCVAPHVDVLVSPSPPPLLFCMPVAMARECLASRPLIFSFFFLSL